MVLKGTIENIVYRNSDNGYTVVHLDVSGILTTATGNFPNINEGQWVELKGNYVKNKTYGEQFSATEVKVLKPKTADGIRKYLASGLISGIGPVTANNIVNAFGEATLDVIEFNPGRLAEVKGVSAKKAEMVAEAFKDLKKMQSAVMFLQMYNISTNLSLKIYDKYGELTEEKLKTNPYRLVEDVDGIGFLTADKIAVEMGISYDSEFRIRAGILHILKDSTDRGGNTFLPKKNLVVDLTRLIKIRKDEYEEKIDLVLQKLVLDGVVKNIELEGEKIIMISKFFNIEKYIAEKLVMLKQSAKCQNINLDAEIEDYQKANNIKLHKGQQEAVKMAVNSGISVITGGPGTGKTTIVKCVINSFKMMGKKIMVLAPTGRAAKRLNESTGFEAKTIHRALDLDFKNGKGMFTYNENEPLDYDAIIVDEVSMVDASLMYYLLKAIKNSATLVLVGDKNQLPSVGAGNVLADIIKSEVIPVYNLTKIYRQNETSVIVTNAHKINKGEMPTLDNKSKDFFFERKEKPEEMLKTIVNLQVNRLPNYLKIEPVKIQVLAPLRAGACGVENLNRKLQEEINPPRRGEAELVTERMTYRLRDKVMNIVNNYQQEWRKYNGRLTENGTGVFNGDIGYITEIDAKTKDVTVLFEDGRETIYTRSDLGQLVLAYATTIHKSQGSEFDVVIIPVIAGAPTILTKNLLYTAVTRAKQMVVLVGSTFNIKRMISNNYTQKRYSLLFKLLKDAEDNIKFLYE